MMRKLVLSAVLALAPAVAFAADTPTPGTDVKPAPVVKADTTVKSDAVKTEAGKTDAVKTDAVVKPEVKSEAAKPVTAAAKDTKAGATAHKAVEHKGKTSGTKAKAAPSDTKTDSTL